MTRPDLDSLAALLDKATPGLWRVDCVGEDEEMVMRTIHGKPSAGGSEVCIVTTGSYDDATEAKNADLIVAAVNALPALLAYVRKLEAERDALREVVRAAVEIASRICAASDGIGVINAVAELRPMLPKMRGVLYDLDAARAKVPK